jgi:hypothetical protein
MKSFRLFLIAFACLPAALTAQTLPENPSPANSQSWETLRGLDRGAPIKVHLSGDRTLHCDFAGATPDYLFCDPRFSFYDRNGYRFDRAEVGEVRLDQFHRNRRILLLSTTLAGFAAGYAIPPNTSSGYDPPRVVDAMILGGAGFLAGYLASPLVSFLPGKRIYRANPHDNAAPATKSAPHAADQAPVQP